MYWQILSPEGLAASVSAMIDEIIAATYADDESKIVRRVIPDTMIELWYKPYDDYTTYEVSLIGVSDPVFAFELRFDEQFDYQLGKVSRYRVGRWLEALNQYHAQINQLIHQDIDEYGMMVMERSRTAFEPIDDQDLLNPPLTSDLVKTSSKIRIVTLVQELNGDDAPEDFELEDYLNDGWEIIQIGVHSDALNRLIRTVTLRRD